MSDGIQRWRAEAGALVEMLDEAPEHVDPVQAGATGYLLVDLADPTSADAASALRLLEFGVAMAPVDRLSPAWRLALGIIHRWLALEGDEQAWRPAFRWFEQARATSANSTDEMVADTHLNATDELGDLYVVRMDVLRSAATEVDAALLAEFERTLTALAELAATTDDPGCRALLHGGTARVLVNRYGATDSIEDLDRAAGVLADALPQLEKFDCVAEYLMLFAALRREQFALRRDTSLIREAVDAMTAAIERTPQDEPNLPLRHLELAELLSLRDNQGSPPAMAPGDRDRIIEHLAVAVTADLSPEDYCWYGELLLDRGNESDNVDDLRAAVHWLNRCLDTSEQSDTDPAGWEVQDALSDAHTSLFDLTHDLTHAGLAIDCATRALSHPLPDHSLAQKLHYRRLNAVFTEPERPDLRTLLDELPVIDWLRAARQAVDVPDGVDAEPGVTGLLALIVANGRTHVLRTRMRLLISQPGDVTPMLADQAYLYGLAREVPDTPVEYRDLTDMLGELFANLHRLTSGDREVDLAATERILANPELADLRADMSGIVGLNALMSGSNVGSLSALRLSGDAFRVDDPTLSESDRAEREAFRDVAEAFRLMQANGDLREVHRLLSRAMDLLAPLAQDGGGDTRQMVELMLSVLSAELPDVPRIGLTETPDVSPWTRMVMAPLRLASGLAVAVRSRDVDGVRRTCRQLDEMTGSDQSVLPAAVASMRGIAYHQLSKLDPSDSHALAVAIDEYTTHAAALREIRSPHFTQTAWPLAEALRRRAEPGDLARSRELALDIMGMTGWMVLVQSDPDDGLQVAARAAAAADQFIGWCVADGAYDDLVRVIDARRGLVLQAANTNQTVAQRLAAAGHTDLAEQWEAVDGADQRLLTDAFGADASWGGLRRSVLRALADAGEDLVSPAGVRDIQDALAVQGADMFAYLVPAGEHHGGLAVLVYPKGPVQVRPLPELRTGPGSVVDRYNTAYTAASHTMFRSAAEYDDWRTALRATCRWAWSAAAERLLTWARTGSDDPTIVLCPLGMLGLVPWHAAYRPVGDGERHLVQDATVSSVPSGRLLHNSVMRPDVEAGTDVLVGNPARNLVAGAVEAMAIRDAFYPSGLFLGGTTEPPRPWVPAPDGAGTPEQLTEMLRTPLRVLHMACHAIADLPHPLLSAIELAGQPSADLTAKDLLDLSRIRPLEVGLVILAVCMAQVSGVEYDEALGLSSTFLAIGARTVIGSLWPVPAGRTTAHLMFVFHQFLRQDGRSPAEALRRAQLWLLNPDRRRPPAMPERMWRMRPDRDDDTAVECWAAFVHQGR